MTLLRPGALIALVLSLLALNCTGSAAKPALDVDLASQTAWTFAPDTPGGKAKITPVPAGGWRLNGFPDATSGTYTRSIAVPKLLGADKQVTQIAFEAVNWEATVLAGPDTDHLQTVGHHLSPWTPFVVDISSAVTPGRNAVLQVKVRDRNFYKDSAGAFTIPAGFQENDGAARGIIRGVSLRVYPTVYIEDVFVKPSTAANTLTVELSLNNASDQPQTLRIASALSAWNSTKKTSVPKAEWHYPALPDKTLTIAPVERRVVVIGPVAWTPGRASLWWPNVPYRADYRAVLHTLRVGLSRPPRGGIGGVTPPLQIETVRFGFCSPGQVGNTYTLNGVRLNLRGDNLSEGAVGTDAFARLPGFLPPASGNPGWPDAVRNYQRLNVNVVRMQGVPATRYMMNVCDELGLLVIPETAIQGGGGKNQNVLEHPDAYTTHLTELIARDRNHPSVFKWSLEDELRNAPEAFLRSLYDACRRADGTRPCSLDDNADAPALPGFAVIEHATQSPGTPDAAGGHPRLDRPFGQGEYAGPEGATPRGPLWFGLMTRAMRAHDNADLRPYRLLDLWPGVIPGLTPANFPASPTPGNAAPGGARASINSPLPWKDGRIRLIQRSFAPVAAYDRAYDAALTPGNGIGQYPAIFPALTGGAVTRRALDVFNDEFAGDRLQARLEPVLLDAQGKRTALPTLQHDLIVAPGSHASLMMAFPVPTVAANATLQMTIIMRKAGVERYREENFFTVVGSGAGGSEARFVARDAQTQGDWPGKYGSQAFFIPLMLGKSASQRPELNIGFGLDPPGQASNSPFINSGEDSTMVHLSETASVNDIRVARSGPGSPVREPSAFASSTEMLYVRVRTTDAAPRRLSLYLLDYARAGQSYDVTIYDRQGHPLDTRRVDGIGEGLYLQYQFHGSVIVQIRSLTADRPTLSGVFVDAAP